MADKFLHFSGRNMGPMTPREETVSHVRSVVEGKEFKAISDHAGFPYSWCTFTPLRGKQAGLVAFHWYRNCKWEGRTAIVSFANAVMFCVSPTSMLHYVLEETGANVA